MPPGGPQVAQLPLLLDSDCDLFGVVVGHMAKTNPHWRAFSRSLQSRAIFHGLHGYILPRWYSSEKAVPIWNYVAVHVFGAPPLVEGTEGTAAHLNELIRHHEGTASESWGSDRLPVDTFTAMLNGIERFDMCIERTEGKAKLGQNRSRCDVRASYGACKRRTRLHTSS